MSSHPIYIYDHELLLCYTQVKWRPSLSSTVRVCGNKDVVKCWLWIEVMGNEWVISVFLHLFVVNLFFHLGWNTRNRFSKWFLKIRPSVYQRDVVCASVISVLTQVFLLAMLKMEYLLVITVGLKIRVRGWAKKSASLSSACLLSHHSLPVKQKVKIYII